MLAINSEGCRRWIVKCVVRPRRVFFFFFFFFFTRVITCIMAAHCPAVNCKCGAECKCTKECGDGCRPCARPGCTKGCCTKAAALTVAKCSMCGNASTEWKNQCRGHSAVLIYAGCPFRELQVRNRLQVSDGLRR